MITERLKTDSENYENSIARAAELLEAPGASYAVTPNAEIVYEAMHDAAFAQLINGAALVLPDGAGVVKAARILGTPLQQKVAGIDFAAALLDVLAAQGKRLYLLGSKPGVAEQAALNLLAAYPGLLTGNEEKLRGLLAELPAGEATHLLASIME